METLFIYFLKVNLALALMYIVYRLLFQRDTFFRLRRFTLLAIYLIAFLYPLPDLSTWLSSQTGMTEVVAYYTALVPGDYSSETIQTIVEPQELYTPVGWKEMTAGWFLLLYAGGIGLLLFRCVVELVAVVRTSRQSLRCISNDHTYYILAHAGEPYSFFRWIFVSPDNHLDNASLDEILVHESTHAREWHSVDMVLGEMVCILCWLNPFAWWLKKEVSLNHEYIADSEVMYAGYDKKTYQYHLLGMEHPQMAAANLYNNFSLLPLKKRITMLNKKRTHSVRRVKYLALLPLALGLLLVSNLDATARILKQIPVIEPVLIADATPVIADEPAIVQPPQEDKIYTIVEIPPEFIGGEKALFDFLNKNVKYPSEAKEKKISGRVQVRFIVEKDGSLTEVEILRGRDPLLDQEAIRVIKSMPKWKPGIHKDGTVARVRFSIPVVFKLTGQETAKPATAQSTQPTASQTPQDDNKIYDKPDVAPDYIGGEAELNKFINKNTKYPVIAQENGIQGRVQVSFIVEKDGSIADAQILRSRDPSLDGEAIRVIASMPKWKPGTVNGKAVRVKHNLPVTFRLYGGGPEATSK